MRRSQRGNARTKTFRSVRQDANEELLDPSSSCFRPFSRRVRSVLRRSLAIEQDLRAKDPRRRNATMEKPGACRRTLSGAQGTAFLPLETSLFVLHLFRRARKGLPLLPLPKLVWMRLYLIPKRCGRTSRDTLGSLGRGVGPRTGASEEAKDSFLVLSSSTSLSLEAFHAEERNMGCSFG